MSDFNAQIISEFRANGGHVETAGFGDNLLILHTIGAKSGQVREIPLFALPDDAAWLVVGSAAGSPKHPAWVHNLRAHPQIDVEKPGQDGIDTVSVTVTEVADDDWAATWARFTEASPGFREYEKTAEGRRFPIFRLAP
ncbi:nitroreductase/quinone reductase family protein [Williamsia deligens]|uniref:Nitroreductase/quinone reductase family protein n=1 Tax=Williamsia deligens TaxID=321325 RepID=A0ABW3G7L8_9NOCA|nr:nitroreductase/quinone reductase family protein [Williamsia deligens]MCP2192767.1 deazaflavin-dependent oxidoreductase, nitroreductase family [Williamsia deligens]